jgi:hypothetical protein
MCTGKKLMRLACVNGGGKPVRKMHIGLAPGLHFPQAHSGN